MVLLHSNEHHFQNQLSKALHPITSQVITIPVATDLITYGDIATSIVIGIDKMPPPGFVQDLIAVQTRFPSLPLIAVLPQAIDVLVRLAPLAITQVVWLSDMEVTLVHAVQNARSKGFLQRFGASIEAQLNLGQHLRLALVKVCYDATAPASVKRLAIGLNCSPRTLQRQWRMAVGDTEDWRIQDFVDCMLLFRVVSLAQPNPRCVVAARRLNIHQDRIGRIALRLFGRSVHEFMKAGPAALTTIIETRIPNRLLSGAESRSFK